MTDIDNQPDHSIWPLLTADDALGLRAWLADLGFAAGVCVADGARVHHSEMRWPEGGRLMVCSADPGDPTLPTAGSTRAYVVTDRPNEVYARALELGARIVCELGDTDYGSRGFGLATPEGHRLSFGTHAG